MAKLFFFGGEKGGVGKSFVARTAIQYHLDRGIKFSLFDADRSNPDVKRIYGKAGCRDAIFSESEKHEDKALAIYLAARKKQTLVNLPSQIMTPFKDWFEENEIIDSAAIEGVEITHLFVCNGGDDSLRLFEDYLDYFKGEINHVLVKNWGLCDEWETLETDGSLMEKIDEYEVQIIDFPKFKGVITRNLIDRKSLTFGVAREYKEFNMIYRQRSQRFLKNAYQAFDGTGIFYNDVELDEFSELDDEAEVAGQLTEEIAS